MSLLAAVFIYFIIWWLVLFAVLPWGAHSAHELGQNVKGGEAPSAPVNPALLKKFLATTGISALVFIAVSVLIVTDWISLDDVPFVPDFRTE